jgi:phosphatidylserine/phosphatidylglycerophosphate/cardiolipin synthase-like enzyme
MRRLPVKPESATRRKTDPLREKDYFYIYEMKKIFRLSILFLIAACSSESPKEPVVQTDFCSSIHFPAGGGLSEKLAPFSEQMKSKTGVYVLEDGGGSMCARAYLCESAEKSIDIQYFIFSADNVGLIAVDYLVRAADRGVKVRILVDDVMVEADEEKLLTLDSHENIEIKIYNPVSNVGKNAAQKLGSLQENFNGVNQRMHNKTFNVDGKVVITGGRNIADEYFDYDHEYNFRDRDVLLIGGVVSEVHNSFEKFWSSPIARPVSELTDAKADTSANRFETLHQYACDSANFWPQVREQIRHIPEAFESIVSSGKLQWADSVNFVSDIPGKNNSKSLSGGGVTTDSLISLVKHAKHSVVIQSPYLVTTDLGKKLFAEATRRGVEIKIMTNSLASTDNLEAFSGYQRDRLLLLGTGVRIFEFKPDAAIRRKVMTGALQKEMDYAPVFGLHAKSMVIDGEITVIGTFNLDPRSANLNTECVTVIRSKEIARGVLSGMEEEMKPENCWETTLHFNPDSEASLAKQVKVIPMKVIPKDIL